MNKQREQAQIFSDIEKIANVMPAPIYWLDTKGIVLGVNDLTCILLGGLNMREKIVGQGNHNFYPKDIAEALIANNNKVLELGKTIEFEEKIVDIITGKIKYITSIRSPLLDDGGNIIGIIGTSVDITDKKENERLNIEKIKQSKVYEDIEKIANIMPAPIYWMDTKSVVLGVNDLTCIALGGLQVRNKIVGKKHHDFYPRDVANALVANNNKVLELGKTIEFEEKVVNLSTGAIQYFTSIRSPIRDENGIIGIIGTLVDITDKKENERLTIEKIKHTNIFEYIEKIANVMPAPIYWLDTKGIVLGVNDLTCILLGGLNMREKIVSQEDHNFYPKDIAEALIDNNNKVLELGKSIEFEEKIVDIITGKIKYITSIRSPLFDDNGNIIGIIGTSVDITDKKKAEQLELENQAHIIRAEEDEKFRRIVNQVVHDIRAPVASVIAIAKPVDSLPEAQRVALRNAGNRINDLANNLLSQYSSNHNRSTTQHKRRDLLVSGAINEALGEKRIQYYESLINFEADFSQNGNFAFINIEVDQFKRMLSNLLNNSIDAFDGKSGKIIVKLDCDDKWVSIIIKDSGKGMSPELVGKIMNNISITEGKKDGHGIGMSQIRETLQSNDGNFKINSILGQSTEITLTFPKIASPWWIADNIKVHTDDIIVVLDDDPSIHGAWSLRFETDIHHMSSKLNHFESGQKTINFINTLAPEYKQKVFLLVDYELLNQGINGLDVVEQTKIERSILVTSHHENVDIQTQARKTRTRILPKLLAPEVPIKVINLENNSIENDEIGNYKKQVDLVVIDDDVMLMDNLRSIIFKNKNVDIYTDVQVFLVNVKQYAKGTKFLVDNNYDNYHGELRDISIYNTGFDLAKLLYELGFTNIYLFSGDVFSNIPDYLKAINKAGIDEIEALMESDFEKREQIDLKQQLLDVIENFNTANFHELRTSTLYDIPNIMYKINKKPAKIPIYIEQAKEIGVEISKNLKDEVDTITEAKKILSKKAWGNNLLECNVKSNLMENKISFALKKNIRLLAWDVKHTFKYLGNVVIVDLILLNLLKYSVSQIQRGNNGNITLGINKYGKTNKIYVKYKAQKVNATPPENDSYYAKNYEFCKYSMALFGGSLTTKLLNDNSVEFILAFPKIQKSGVTTELL